MAKSNHYSKAPITEALLDIRVKLPPESNLSALASIYNSVSQDYPHLENTLSIENNLTTGQSLTHQTKTSFTGFRFWHANRKQVFQARLDGFTFSRLAPYENWDNLKDEAQKLWEIYEKITKPQRISRISVRYINRLDLPLPIQDFSDYLQITPEVSPGLPQGVSDYLIQLRIPEQEGGWLAITEAILPSDEEKDFVSVALDMNLSRELDIAANSNDLWKLLEKMRARKNQIFEACITDKTRGLIS